jgi:hypothetical protein
MKPLWIWSGCAAIVLVGGVYAWRTSGRTRRVEPQKAINAALRPEMSVGKNLTYYVDDEALQLVEGTSTDGTARYFGNAATGDLDGDGRDDVAFLLTRDTEGSGTFYYVAAALRTDDGYEGTNAVFLGDRIAPQTTGYADGRAVVNYADRNPGEPFSAQPSLGVSRYFSVAEGILLEVPPPWAGNSM